MLKLSVKVYQKDNFPPGGVWGISIYQAPNGSRFRLKDSIEHREDGPACEVQKGHCWILKGLKFASSPYNFDEVLS